SVRFGSSSTFLPALILVGLVSSVIHHLRRVVVTDDPGPTGLFRSESPIIPYFPDQNGHLRLAKMPLDEEGAKWSCEPCIRGHRSSKCQHFDRLMMKVPKAGRPLAKCPHPKGTCSCQKTYAVMVRIPKGSSCLCRPLYKVPADQNDSNQSTPGSVSQVSSPSPAKVQKSGRRQSTIQAAPENIVKALESMPEDVKLEDNMANYLANLPTHQPRHNGTHPDIDESHVYSSTSTSEDPREKQPEKGSSCCSQKPEAPPVTPSGSGEKSCCSGKTTTPAVPSLSSHVAESNSKQPPWNDVPYMRFPTSQASPWQTPVASTHGPFMQPYRMPQSQLQPFYTSNYPQQMSSTSYSNAMNGLGIAPPSMAPFPSSGLQNQTQPPMMVGGEACHDCKCGDECQCLGCAAHPFNNTTRQHVQEMGVMMTFDGEEQTPEAIAKAYQSPPYHGSAAPTPLNYYMMQAPSMDQAPHQNSFGPYGDPNSAIPGGYSSPPAGNLPMNQQLMHPSEYYTLEYPVGIPSACSDITGSCQCGNDCSCVGCLTHSGHNGLALEAPIPDPAIADTTTPSQVSSHHGPPHHGPPIVSAGSHLSRIPVLENVSVSCLSPRTLETSMI
ncbi:hypothetical protein N7492_007018, partial [Penicillium capsulatum]